MADQDSNTPGNGAGEPNAGHQAAVLAQYVKDLSVESPSSPQVFQWQEQPRLDVQFNINVDRVADEVHEVVLKMEVSARSERGVHFLIDLSYGGLFGLRGIPEEAAAPFLLIDAPRLLFPFARQIVAEASQNTGFPPILLDPIDFESAFRAQLQAAQAQQAQQGQQGQQENGGAAGNGEAAGSDQNPTS